MFAKLMPGEFEDLNEIRNEYEAKVYCQSWLPERRWLQKNEIDYSKYPEEIKFRKCLKEYRFFRRAAATQLLHAHNFIREEMVANKMNEKFQK
jgi:hypothetical protein